MHHPTPIREESGSAERRPGFIAETPSTSRVPGTPSTTTTSRIAETPRTGRVLGYDAAPVSDRTEIEGTDDDDDFDDLMVMTDEETEDDQDTSPGPATRGLIPETPVK